MQSCVWEVRGSAFHHLSTAATFVASPLGAAYLSCVELSLEADIWAALSSGKEGRKRGRGHGGEERGCGDGGGGLLLLGGAPHGHRCGRW